MTDEFPLAIVLLPALVGLVIWSIVSYRWATLAAASRWRE